MTAGSKKSAVPSPKGTERDDLDEIKEDSLLENSLSISDETNMEGNLLKTGFDSIKEDSRPSSGEAASATNAGSSKSERDELLDQSQE